MQNNFKSYKRVLLTSIKMLIYLVLSLSATAQITSLVDSNAIKKFSGVPSKDNIEYLDIFLLSSFDDSVIVSLGQRNIFSRFCKTNHSLGQAGSITVLMPYDGQIVTIYCVNERLQQTVKFTRGYSYLYIWKNLNKFQFEFTNKIRWLE